MRWAWNPFAPFREWRSIATGTTAFLAVVWLVYGCNANPLQGVERIIAGVRELTTFSDTEPGVTYLFDRKTKKLTKQYAVCEKLPRDALSKMKVVRYPSSDGLMIPAYLTIPKGTSGKNLPVLVTPHGGPWGRGAWGYNTWAQ